MPETPPDFSLEKRIQEGTDLLDTIRRVIRISRKLIFLQGVTICICTFALPIYIHALRKAEASDFELSIAAFITAFLTAAGAYAVYRITRSIEDYKKYRSDYTEVADVLKLLREKLLNGVTEI